MADITDNERNPLDGYHYEEHTYNTSFIGVGTVGDNNWTYTSGAPFGYASSVDVRPFSLFGVCCEYGSGPEYEQGYLKDKLLEYSSYLGAFGEKVLFVDGPHYTLKGYKMCFVKDGSLDDVYGGYTLVGQNERGDFNVTYNDLVVEGHSDYIVANAWHHAISLTNLRPESASFRKLGNENVSFTLEEDPLVTNDEYQMMSSIPIFTWDGQWREYLASPDPDPTHFGGKFASYRVEVEDEEEEDPEEGDRGPSIEDTNTDPGLDLANGPVRAFICDDENLQILSDKVSKGLFERKLGDGIISIKIIKTPGAIDAKPEEDIIPAGALTPAVRGQYVRHQFQAFDFGTLKIPEQLHNFVDYNGTKCSLYLPYSGVHNLDVRALVGGSISLQAVIDYVSGSVIWQVKVSKDGVSQVLWEFTGNVSCDIPLTGLEYGQKITQLLTGLMTTGSGVASNNAMQTITGLEYTLSHIGNIEPIQIGNLASNFSWPGIQYPFLIFQRNKIVYPSNFASTVGKPSMKREILGNLRGFTQVYDMHLDGINCFELERERILEALKEGVIL